MFACQRYGNKSDLDLPAEQIDHNTAAVRRVMRSMPAIIWISSPKIWSAVPTPCEAMLIFPGLALA